MRGSGVIDRIKRLWHWFSEAITPPRKVRIIEGYDFPSTLPRRDLILLREEGEDVDNWAVGLRCPCGCGETIELALLPVVVPRWELSIDKKGRPTLSPSVWKKSGCRSHFWLRRGVVQWCDPR